MAEAHHPAAAVAGEREDGDRSGPHPEPGSIRCCCGSEECVFLRHNCSVLASVEKDVHTAARMGQVRFALSCRDLRQASSLIG